LDGPDDIDGAIVPLSGIRLKEVSHNLFERLRHHRIETQGAQGKRVQELSRSWFLSASIPTENLEQHQSNCIEISPWSQLSIPASPLFGSHPYGRSTHAFLVKSKLGYRSSESQVSHPSIGGSVHGCVQQHIGWFEVLMQKTASMNVGQGIEDMFHQSDCIAHGGTLFE
jgi:hypothetical protein